MVHRESSSSKLEENRLFWGIPKSPPIFHRSRPTNDTPSGRSTLTSHAPAPAALTPDAQRRPLLPPDSASCPSLNSLRVDGRSAPSLHSPLHAPSFPQSHSQSSLHNRAATLSSLGVMSASSADDAAVAGGGRNNGGGGGNVLREWSTRARSLRRRRPMPPNSPLTLPASTSSSSSSAPASPFLVSPDSRWATMPTAHFGTKPGHFETSIIHFPTSEGVSESEQTSERVSTAEGASEASSLEQANE